MPYFAIDTETTSIDWQKAELVGVSIATINYEGYYIPVGHTGDFDILLDNQLDRDFVLNELKPILQNPNIGKIGQHIKYDSHVFKKYGIELNNWHMDTMLASYVINGVATRHNMDDLARHYLGVNTTTFEEQNSLALIKWTWIRQAIMRAKMRTLRIACLVCLMSICKKTPMPIVFCTN